jgi:hypothetical protein
VRADWGRSLALLAGLAADAKSGVSAAEGAAFADQAVAALRDVASSGWIRPDILNPDYAYLRPSTARQRT